MLCQFKRLSSTCIRKRTAHLRRPTSAAHLQQVLSQHRIVPASVHNWPVPLPPGLLPHISNPHRLHFCLFLFCRYLSAHCFSPPRTVFIGATIHRILANAGKGDGGSGEGWQHPTKEAGNDISCVNTGKSSKSPFEDWGMPPGIIAVMIEFNL